MLEAQGFGIGDSADIRAGNNLEPRFYGGISVKSRPKAGVSSRD